MIECEFVLKDDKMDQLYGLFTNKLKADKVSEKIQKIIFNIIFQHIQDMVYVMKVEKGPSFRYLFVNEAGIKKAHISIDSIGKKMEETLTHSIAAFLKEKYEKVLKRKEAIVFNDSFFHDDGQRIYGETILTPIFNDKGSIAYIVAVTRDVTVWKMEKNNLIESEQRYRSIVDNNMDAIFAINLEGKILEANPAASHLTGYAEKQMISRSIYNLINDYNLEDFKVLLEKTCSGYALESLECKIIHSKGHLLLVHIKTVPIAIYGDIKGMYVILRDLTEQTKNMEIIKFMAFHDQLTGLLNRRALLEHLNEQIHSPIKNQNEFALISLDIDRFKYFNDTLGHFAGDEILKQFATRLSVFQNDNCFVYRQGGDEFNLLLLNTNRESAGKFVQKLFSAFNHSFYFNSQEYFISTSVGISLYPNDGKDAEMLIKNADEALFRVKEKGKGHYQFYRTDMNSVFTNVITLETHLRKAIDKEELTLSYQPQIDIVSGKVTSFEALLRWNDSEFGAISPTVFIPLAEDTGLIVPIGNWVIDHACQQIKRWNGLGVEDIRVSINISPKQFQQPNLVAYIDTMIKKYNLHPSSLGIEITESAMTDAKETIPILKKLKELGISISVDDFGTGFSSLNYLKQFPIDTLKIDQSFIRDILVDNKAAAITSTIIHLGQSLGLEVIAEGAEQKEQVDFLLRENCHKIQGFYYSKPIPAREVEQKYLLIK